VAIHVERHPLEAASHELREALRAAMRPVEDACRVVGGIGLLRLKSATAEADFAAQLRAIARQIKARESVANAKGDGPRSILKGLQDLERNIRALAIS
jgi:hypothetical protein